MLFIVKYPIYGPDSDDVDVGLDSFNDNGVDNIGIGLIWIAWKNTFGIMASNLKDDPSLSLSLL